MLLALRADGGRARKCVAFMSSFEATALGPLRLLLRLLRLRAAVPRPLPRLPPVRGLRPRAGRPARLPRRRARRRARRRRLPPRRLGAVPLRPGRRRHARSPAAPSIVFVEEGPRTPSAEYDRLRTYLARSVAVVRRERNVRRFLIANTAWEATFAGMRTFVVLYIIDGLEQPLYVSSVVLAVVAGGYVTAAALSGLFGDRFGLGNVILGASWVYGLGLLSAGFAQQWHWWYYALDRARWPRPGGIVMTLAWGLLYKIMPPATAARSPAWRPRPRGSASSSGRSPPGPRSTSSGPYLERHRGLRGSLAGGGRARPGGDPAGRLLADVERESLEAGERPRVTGRSPRPRPRRRRRRSTRPAPSRTSAE